ncbi:MAG: hypothetical protein ACK5X3_10030 [Pseudomonadota bacterium]|jgi:hypothetical protein
MPIFGKRKGNMTPEEQEAARQRRRQLLETIGATMSDVGAGMQGEQGAQLANLRQRRENAMQEAQRMAAFNDLMGQIQPPDTETPQVNEMIGAANQTGARFGMAPMQRQTPRPSGLDLQDPRTREALMSFISAGGNVDAPFALADRIAPPAPNMSLFNTRSGVVGINPQTGETQELYSDPYAEALAQRQIDAQGALAEQRRASGRANMIRANRPPAARAGGASGDAPTAPTPTGRRF